MNSIDTLTSNIVSSQFVSTQGALNAFEHDHAFLSKRISTIDTDDTSTKSKFIPTNESRRTSSRLRAREKYSTITESSSSVKSKNKRNINRATDIRTSDDLSYYLERRRKNNEASKLFKAILY